MDPTDTTDPDDLNDNPDDSNDDPPDTNDDPDDPNAEVGDPNADIGDPNAEPDDITLTALTAGGTVWISPGPTVPVFPVSLTSVFFR